MDSNLRTVLGIFTGLGCVSMIYFLCLVLAFPFPVCIVLLLLAFIVIAKYLSRLSIVAPIGKNSWLATGLLLIGVFLITNRSYHLAKPWGEWDAWGIWNYHARFLTDGKHWRAVFQSVQYDHPDYPFGLSGTVAFIARLCGGAQHLMLVSFGLSFFITLFVPVLMFVALQRRNIWIAGSALLLFATNDYYIEQGVSQSADTLVAAFLLAAIIAVQEAKNNPKSIALAAFFACGAAWAKNEGIVLALLFFLFYANVLFSRKGIRYFAAGATLPLLTLAIFKIFYAPPNDLFHDRKNVAAQLSDPHRYSLIRKYFSQNCREHFLFGGVLLLLYAGTCIYQKRWPRKPMFFLLACLGAYMFTYVLTPYDPEWHIITSQGRLMLQLMPAFVFVMADSLCAFRLARIRQHAL